MEEDALVVLLLVVVVPVQQRDRGVGGQLERVHHHRVGDVHLARAGDAPVAQLAEQHAGRDVELVLQLPPAADGVCVELELVHDLIQHHAQAHQVVHRPRGHGAERGVGVQLGGLVLEGGAFSRHLAHAAPTRRTDPASPR